jgi:multicomponent Na+:H+ antiporter subunit G
VTVAREILVVVFCSCGAFFVLAGTVGLLRFPDTLTRLHALTKADNVGLGLIIVGLAIDAGSVPVSAKLALIWLLALVSAATACYLIGRHASRAGRMGGGGP